jgi:hypothetical protein
VLTPRAAFALFAGRSGGFSLVALFLFGQARGRDDMLVPATLNRRTPALPRPMTRRVVSGRRISLA